MLKEMWAGWKALDRAMTRFFAGFWLVAFVAAATYSILTGKP